MPAPEHRESLSVAVMGQIDSGKSTIVGHLRYQCGCVMQRELEKLAQASADMGKASFKFAWLSDTRKDERERGVSIHMAETQLLTNKYNLEIADLPGHISFAKNAIVGMATMDHGVLVVDATEGCYEVGMEDGGATKEHGLLAFAFGVKQLIVVVNKMDALATPYAQERFDTITTEIGSYLGNIGFQSENVQFIPTSGWHGENLVHKSAQMPWYEGPTLLESFDCLTLPERASDRPLRVPVQDAYHISGIGLVVTGHVQTGVLKRGMQLSFGPTGAKGTVFSIESHHCSVEKAYPGMAVGINIKGLTKNDVKRGYVASDVSCDEARPVTSFTAQLVFLKHPPTLMVQAGYSPVVHCHTMQARCRIQKITAILDRQTGEVLERPTSADGDGALKAKTGDACLVVLEPTIPAVFEAFREYPSLGRIVVRDNGATVAVGIIRSVEKKGVWKP